MTYCTAVPAAVMICSMGGAGDDRIYGGIGNDTLEGGPRQRPTQGAAPDDDMLDGGEGDDVFLHRRRGAGMTPSWTSATEQDRIDLAAFAEISVTVEDLDIQQQATGAVIDLSAQGRRNGYAAGFRDGRFDGRPTSCSSSAKQRKRPDLTQANNVRGRT